MEIVPLLCCCFYVADERKESEWDFRDFKIQSNHGELTDWQLNGQIILRFHLVCNVVSITFSFSTDNTKYTAPHNHNNHHNNHSRECSGWCKKALSDFKEKYVCLFLFSRDLCGIRSGVVKAHTLLHKVKRKKKQFENLKLSKCATMFTKGMTLTKTWMKALFHCY